MVIVLDEIKRVWLKMRWPPYAKRKSGMLAPNAYAKVMIITVNVICPVAARVAIDARIGPAHGDQTMPNETPVASPPKKSVLGLEFVLLEKLVSLLTAPSRIRVNPGISIDKPRKAMTKTATIRRIFGSKWKSLTNDEIAKVKNVKLTNIPSVMPSGRL